jgi:hypothetical protein
MPNVAPRLFIGSSTEAQPVAAAIQTNLDQCAEVTIWNQNMPSLDHPVIQDFNRGPGKRSNFQDHLQESVDLLVCQSFVLGYRQTESNSCSRICS